MADFEELKAAGAYFEFKNIANLKQCSLREFSLAKFHLRYFIKTNADDEGGSGE